MNIPPDKDLQEKMRGVRQRNAKLLQLLTKFYSITDREIQEVVATAHIEDRLKYYQQLEIEVALLLYALEVVKIPRKTVATAVGLTNNQLLHAQRTNKIRP